MKTIFARFVPFMTGDQVKELSEKGFVIGAHSWDHPYYGLIPPEEQQRQTLESMRFVQQRYAPAFSLFSFPHTDAVLPQSFFDNCGNAVDVFWGIQNQKKEMGKQGAASVECGKTGPSHVQATARGIVFAVVTEIGQKDQIIRK